MTDVVRAPMRARDRPELPPGAGAAYGLSRGLVAVGDSPQDGPRAARRLGRFAALSDGTFAWTRDADGRLWLGRIEGPLRSDRSPGARACGMRAVRPARWSARPIPDDEVPAPVLRSFARGGLNLQRIREADPARVADLWTTWS